MEFERSEKSPYNVHKLDNTLKRLLFSSESIGQSPSLLFFRKFSNLLEKLTYKYVQTYFEKSIK